MDLPERCFCGCGKSVSKLNDANLQGYVVGIELGKWLNYLTVMKAASPDTDHSQVEQFMDDGGACYLVLLNQVHDGVKMGRKERKLIKRWLKFSRNTQAEIGQQVSDDEPNPFEIPVPNAQQVRAWVFDGTLLPIED